MASDVDYQLLPLVRRLSIMVSNLLFTHRESLVGSGDWPRLEKTLNLVDGRFAATELCMDNVTRRNQNFNGSRASHGSTSAVSARRKAVDYLDSVALPFNAAAMFQQLGKQISREEIVPCIFEWAVTSLRSGHHRVYLGAELLRLAKKDNLDIQIPIIEFLGRLDVHTKVKKHDVYLLISELARTECFSLAIYMKWLIAKGGIKGQEGLGEVCTLSLKVCTMLIFTGLPVHRTSFGRDSDTGNLSIPLEFEVHST